MDVTKNTTENTTEKEFVFKSSGDTIELVSKDINLKDVYDIMGILAGIVYKTSEGNEELDYETFIDDIKKIGVMIGNYSEEDSDKS